MPEPVGIAPIRLPDSSVSRVATPVPLKAKGRSTADTGIVPSSRRTVSIRVRIFVKGFIAFSLKVSYSFRVTYKAFRHSRVVSNQKTSHYDFAEMHETVIA